MKKFFCLITALLIFSISTVNIFADTGEYNDYVLYNSSNNNANVASGVFYSNDTTMSSFTLYVNDVTQKWYITSGSQTDVPKPSGMKIGDMSSAYVMVNGNRYSFSHVTQTDFWAVYNIPASPYYPVVSVYIPFVTDTGDDIPSTPTLSIDGKVLTWTPSGYEAKVLYSTDGSIYETYRNSVSSADNSLTIQLDKSAYFRVQLYYTVEGETMLTDVSNRVEYTYIPDDPTDPDDNKTIWDYMSDLIDGLSNAVRTVTNFLESMKTFFYQLFAWLPEEVMVVFWAVIIIGLVFGILIK